MQHTIYSVIAKIFLDIFLTKGSRIGQNRSVCTVSFAPFLDIEYIKIEINKR